MLYVLGLIENVFCAALLPAVLFITGAVFFIGLAKHVFSPKFFIKHLKSGNSSVSSLWLALGGTLGVGNICGVASAIYIGGPGCIFWIWICAFLCAITKYVESLLSVHYKGKYSSGAFSYIEHGLNAKRLARFFAILCIITAFTMGNITQVKAAADFAKFSLDIPPYVCGIVFSICVFMLTVGKNNAITTFTSYAVPVLCGVYTLCCFGVIWAYSDNILPLTQTIIKAAFTPVAGVSGFWGFLCSPALRLGITRGVMSNEAGCGTAPIAYCSQPNAMPIKCGLFGVIEVLVDTLFLCTLTAYAILLPQIPLSSNSAQSILSSFGLVFGSYISPVITVSVFLFALASVAAWSFYATSCAKHLGLKKGFFITFSLLYPATSFIGCFVQEKFSWLFSDICISIMAITNIFVLLLLSDKAKKLTRVAHI